MADTFWHRHPNLTALLLFIGLTIAVSWPLPRHFNSLIAGQDSDVAINIWADWWTGRALSDGQVSLWETDAIFYPVGTDLSFHSFSHLNSLVALALAPLLGRIAAYNTVILLNFVLCGLAMFQLARHVTGSTAAALLAGIVFAFNPHNQYQSAHPVLLSIWGIPWATLFLLRGAQEKQLRWAAVAGGFAVLTAAVSTLVLILLAAWSGIYLLYLWLDRRQPAPGWRLVGVYSGISALGSLPFLWPLLRSFLLERNSSFLISSSDLLYIADIASPLIPHWYVWLVRGLYLGLVPLFLLIIGRRRWREAYLWYGLLLGAYLLSIGPYPTLLGSRLDVTLPWSLPVVPLLRNPYRLNILLSLGLAMLVAVGWQVFAGASLTTRRRAGIGAALCGLLIFGEYGATPFPLTQLPVSPFYSEVLATVPDDVALATLPGSRSLGKTYMYFQSIHGHPITGGAVSRRSDAALAFMRSNGYLRAGNLDEGSGPPPLDVSDQLAPLAGAGIGYLVLHRPFLDDEALWRRRLPFDPVYEDELLLVYRTDPQPGRDYRPAAEGALQLLSAAEETADNGGVRWILGWYAAETIDGVTVTLGEAPPAPLPAAAGTVDRPVLFVTAITLPAGAPRPQTLTLQFPDAAPQRRPLP